MKNAYRISVRNLNERDGFELKSIKKRTWRSSVLRRAK
jgi:hypothetical protein